MLIPTEQIVKFMRDSSDQFIKESYKLKLPRNKEENDKLLAECKRITEENEKKWYILENQTEATTSVSTKHL